MPSRAELRSSLRALFGVWAGDRTWPPPDIPPGIPETVLPLVREAVAALIHYQGVAHARLYLHRLRRFIGRRDVDAAMFANIVRLMAERMTYDDPMRLAQLTLDEAAEARHPVRRHCRFRYDELFEPLPSPIALPVLGALAYLGWTRRMMTRRYSAHSSFARARLRIEAGLRRWRGLGRCYERERLWVERWLHMIDRAFMRQPAAAAAIVETATMVRGYGEPYRRGLADWHLIIDGLAKPTFDGALALPDLATAIATARRATLGDDVNQTGLRAAIAAIRDAATCNPSPAMSRSGSILAEGIRLVVPALTSSVAIGALVGWFLALTVKHVIADFLLQTHWMAVGKDRAEGWALPLLVHCLIHAVLTTLLVTAVAPRLWFVGLLDFAIHITIDRAKGFIVAHFNVTNDHAAFWWLIGIDQALHHLTGFGLAILLVVNL